MRLASLLASVSVLLLSAPLHAADPLNIRDLVEMRRVGSPVLAPDGERVAYTVREVSLDDNAGVTRIWLTDVEGGAPRALTAAGSSASSPTFSSDGERLYFLSARGGSQQVWVLPLDGGEASPVTDLPLDVESFALAPDDRTLAVTMRVYVDCETPVIDCSVQRQKAQDEAATSGVIYDRLFVRHWDQWHDGRRAQLFTLALEDGGEPLWVSRGIDADIPSVPFGDRSEYAFTPDGNRLVFSARVAGRSEPWSTNFDLFVVPADGGSAPRNLTADNAAWDTAPVVTPDGESVIYLAMARPGFEADRFALKIRPLTGGAARNIAPDWDRSAGSIALSDDGATVYATADDVGQHPLFAIRVRDGRVTRLTDAGYVSGFSVADGRIALVHDRLDAPADLYLLATRGGEPRRLTAHNDDALQRLAMAPYEQFSFAGHGDETVHYYVMEPVNRTPGKRYPLAFVIHGGPQGSMGNHWHYRWNPQLFAAMGYAVVFIDFHGSTGYGQAFTDSISGDWGGKPLEDLQKGLAAALERHDWIDGERACALGASYGGYMINWIAGNWPQRFDCLVNHDGVFDNRSMYYATEELWFPEWEHGGAPYYANPEAYERHNPVAHVDRWQTPMLVIHGALDYRVPLEQGLATFTALQRRDIPSRFLYFPDENHWVLKPANSVQWYDVVEDWLKRWTDADAAARTEPN